MKTFAKILLIILASVGVVLSGITLYFTIDTFFTGWAVFAAIVYLIYSAVAVVINLIINLILVKKKEFRISLIITLVSVGILAVVAVLLFIVLPLM
ncbi:MAG: hypothetical protein IKC64_06020 [Clostridia bacterium]|nr:hypothetical protein [Clostridia bacterium]